MPYQGDEAFPSEQNISGDNSQIIAHDKKSPAYVAPQLVTAQQCVGVMIILMVLLFSYLLYGRFLRQNQDLYLGAKKKEFIGDLYQDPKRRGGSGGGRKNRDEVSGVTNANDEYMTFGDDASNVSEAFGGAGDSSGYGDYSGYGGNGGGSGRRKKDPKEYGKRGKTGKPARGWFWWLPELYRYPIRKVKDTGSWIGSWFGLGPRNNRDRNKRRRPKDRGDGGRPGGNGRGSNRPRNGKGNRNLAEESPYSGRNRPVDGRSDNSEYPLTDDGRPPKRDFKNKSDQTDPNMDDIDTIKIPREGGKDDIYGNDPETKKEGKGPKGNRPDYDPWDDKDKEPKRKRPKYDSWDDKEPKRKRPKYDSWDDKDPSGKRPQYDPWGDDAGNMPSSKIPDHSNRKYSVPKERMAMPNIEDIRKNPEKYAQENVDFLDSDPEQRKREKELEDKELSDLFGGDDEDDPLNFGDDLDLGSIAGLGLLLDPSFLNKIQAMVHDLNGSVRNMNRNKEMLKKFKREIDAYKKKRDNCRDQYLKEKAELGTRNNAKQQKKQNLADMENEKAKLEDRIKREEEQYMRGDQRDLKKKGRELENDIRGLEAIIKNEKPLLAELDNKGRQENDILDRIKEIKEKIRIQEELKVKYAGQIEAENTFIAENKKNLTISRIKIRGFTKSLAVKEENLKLRNLVDDVRDKSVNITEELNRIYQDKTLSEEELQLILEEMQEFGDLDLDMSYKSDHEKFAALKDTLEELKKKALTMDFKGIEKEIEKLNQKIKKNQKMERTCKNNIIGSNQKIEKLNGRIEKCESTLASLYAELKKLEGQLQKCRDYIEVKTTELKNAKEMRDQKLGQKKDLEKQLQKIQNEHVRQNNELKKEKAGLIKGINRTREDLRGNRANVHKQNRKVNRLVKDCNVYEKYAQDLKRRAMKLKKKLPAQQKAIQKLKKEVKTQLNRLSGMQI